MDDSQLLFHHPGMARGSGLPPLPRRGRRGGGLPGPRGGPPGARRGKQEEIQELWLFGRSSLWFMVYGRTMVLGLWKPARFSHEIWEFPALFPVSQAVELWY